MKILVTGGAGYIGSFTVRVLKEAGYDVVIFDSLENGHREAVPSIQLYTGDLKTDVDKLVEVFKKENPEAVIHFAAYIEAGISVREPGRFYRNNVCGSLNLFKIMNSFNVKKLVFSSTAALYGNPKKIPIKETDPKKPTNPYGRTKLIVEWILKDYAEAKKFAVIPLRYFNAAGGTLDGSLGQDYERPTHLITRACKKALDPEYNFAIFGDDYKTPDGTCIRDYIHVLDLAEAHLKALEYLEDKDSFFEPFNVGTGRGYSVKEVVEMVKKVAGNDFHVPITDRRPGDPDKLVADSTKIKKKLGWQPEYSDLETIISSAYKWHKKHPDGY